jgi:hypothetical protein
MITDTSLTDASDGLAIVMVLLVGFALGMILTLLVVMARNSGKKPDVLTDDEESANEPPKPEPRPPGNTKGSPWERDGDWWKNEDS